MKLNIPIATAAALMIAGNSALAETSYNLTEFPFSYYAATKVEGIIQTNARGTFTQPNDIQNILNSSIFEVKMYDELNIVSTLSNANASWIVDLSTYGSPSIQLTIDENQISLSFHTPTEYSEGALLLKSGGHSQLPSTLQYRQTNNVSNSNAARFDFDAVRTAHYQTTYGKSFIFSASPVPEPTNFAFFLAGVFVLIAIKRNAINLRMTHYAT